MENGRTEEGPSISLGPKDERLLKLASTLEVRPEAAQRLCAVIEHIFMILAFNHGFKINRFEMPIWHELLTDYLKGGELPDRERIEDLFPGAYSEDWGGAHD